MREHIKDPITNFNRYYYNYNSFNILNINTTNYNIYNDYNNKNYNNTIPIPYSDFKSITYNIYNNDNNHRVVSNSYYANYHSSKIIITKNIIYFVNTILSNWISSYGHIYSISITSINKQTGQTNTNRFDLYNEMSDYNIDEQTNTLNIILKKHDYSYSTNIVKDILLIQLTDTTIKTLTIPSFTISNANISIDGNSRYLFIHSPHSSSTANYVPKTVIVDSTLLQVVKTITTYPRTTIASYGYHIACNDTYLLISDPKTRIIQSFVIDTLITSNNYIDALDKTFSNIYDEPLTVGIYNVNAPYYSRINIDNNNNIYIGTYATDYYNFLYNVGVNTNIFPSRFDYNGTLIDQEVLPNVFVLSTYGDIYNISIREDSVSYGTLNNCNYVSVNNYNMIPNGGVYTFEDDTVKIAFNKTNNPVITHKGIMTSENMNYNVKIPLQYNHLTTTEPLSLNLYITNVNDAPILDTIPNQMTDEDTPIDITLNYRDEESTMAELIIDVTSYDASMLTYSIVGNTLKIIPVRNMFGTTIVYLRVRDPQGSVNSQSFTLTVRPVNDKPVTSDSVQITNEDTPLTFNLISKVFDTDNNVFSYIITEQPTNGTVTIDNLSNIVNYVPNPNYNGIDTFKFKVNDGLDDSNESTCTITVKPINDAPLFTDNIPDINIEQQQSATINLMASDIDNTTLSFRATGTGIASYTDNGNGTLTIRAGSMVGSWNINIDVYDANGLYDRRVVNLTVNRLWGDGKLVKLTTPTQLELKDSMSYIMSGLNLTGSMMNDIYKNETHLANYYTKSSQQMFYITDFVAIDNTDVLNYNKINIIKTFILQEEMQGSFSLVIDKQASTGIIFETDYIFEAGEETFDVKSYVDINVIEVKLNDTIFLHIDSIKYIINGKEVIYKNKTYADKKALNTYSKSNYAIYEIDGSSAYLHRLF